jgi:rhodanese-related sulfurtransferase
MREGLRQAGVPPGADPVAAAKDLTSRTKERWWEVEGATTADVATAKALFDGGVPFVDVRNEPNWKKGHIPGAVNLDVYVYFTEVELSKIVRKDQDVVIHCAHPT